MTDSPPVTASSGADVNAIAWGQFQLRGGWKSFWTTTVGYGVVVGAGMLILLRVAAGAPPAVGAIKWSLIAIQAGILVLFACSRISTAVRQDQTSRMLESHRLMPVSPAQAVLGYLVGPVMPPLGIALANLLLGCWLCTALGLSIGLWLTANGVLLTFAMFAAAVSCFGAFAGKPAGVAAGWIAASMGMVNILTIGAILPGVNVLITPLSGPTVWSLGVAGGDALAAYAPSLLLQGWIGATCFAAACRRYRRDDRPALGADLGLALLAGWVGASAVGMVYWENFEPANNRWMKEDPAIQYLGSTMAAMLLGLVPVAGAAWASVDWAGRRAVGDPSPGRRPMPPQVVALAAAGVTLLLAAAAASTAQAGSHSVLVRTATVLVTYFVAMAYVLRVLARVTVKLLLPLMAWVLITWLIPLTIDYALWWVRGADETENLLGLASGFSPVGALVEAWTGRGDLTTPGLIFQCAFAAVVAGAYYLTEPRWARGKPPKQPAE
jgi:hypothetical protein